MIKDKDVDGSITLGPDFRVSSSVVSSYVEFTSLTDFQPGPHGFLLRSMHIDTNLRRNPSSVSFTYQQVGAFQLPSTVESRDRHNGAWSYKLSDCKLFPAS